MILKNASKPENIIEKMITGRLAKEFKEVCLLEQEYVKAEIRKTLLSTLRALAILLLSNSYVLKQAKVLKSVKTISQQKLHQW